jgi:hypothetical protein
VIRLDVRSAPELASAAMSDARNAITNLAARLKALQESL